MIIDELEKKVQGKGVRIVFTEGWDRRVQKAAIDLKNNDVVRPVLLGTPEELAGSAQKNSLNVEESNKSIQITLITWMKWSTKWSNYVVVKWTKKKFVKH